MYLVLKVSLNKGSSMEINQREEMNFSGFLNLMRKKHKVTMEEVCEGICFKSMMNRVETGERLPDKLTRDRLLQRMGVAQETYQDYLMGEEYELYSILETYCIYKKNSCISLKPMIKFKCCKKITYMDGLPVLLDAEVAEEG